MKTPASIFVLHSGGLGDLVRTAPLLRAAHREWPNALITLSCRAEFDAIRELLPVRTAPAPIPFDPSDFMEPDIAALTAVHGIFGSWKAVEADLFICAEARPSWLAGVLAAWFRAGRTAAAEAPEESAMLDRMRSELVLEPAEFEPVPFAIPPLIPWPLPATARTAADRELEALGLTERGYLLCAPMGGWPRSRFGQALDQARATRPSPVLFIGAPLDLAPEGGPVRSWEGGIGDLPLLAGLLAMSRGYFTDSPGIADLGQAFGSAGLCVSGGGCWPEDAPWAANASALVHPLPCFGCGWDCAFGDPVCMASIPARVAGESLAALEPGVRKLDLLPGSELQLIEKAGATYRRARNDAAALRDSAIRARHAGRATPRRGWFGR